MKLLLSTRIGKFFHIFLYIGPLALLSGLAIALLGNSNQDTDITLTGLIACAAGLIIWGCHGMRRRGKRPGFVLMTTFGVTFFFVQLYYRYSDYRWLQTNTKSFATTTTAALTHLESRLFLFIAILLISIVIGLFLPLPAASRPRKSLRRDD